MIAFARPAAHRLARRTLLVACTVLAAIAACSADDASPAKGAGARAGADGAKGHLEGDSSAGAIALTGERYRVVRLGAVGSVSGIVVADGDLPRDSTIAAAADAAACGTRLADESLPHDGPSLGNAVVWLSGITEGKALPIDRRLEIVNEDCQLEPRVQATVAPSTVNVRNEDALAHTMRFRRLDDTGDTGDSLAAVPLIMNGQVVPNEHLARRPGIVEARCEQHPWTRGYIAAFAHPYFAVTPASGGFRLDSVPPGRYTLVVWHERAARPVEREVVVTAGAEATAEVKVRLK